MSMPVKPKVNNYTLKWLTLTKDHLTVKDIMILKECGYNAALAIKQKIQKQQIQDGYQIITTTVPKKRVLAELGIDEDYIFKMAKKEQALNLTNQATMLQPLITGTGGKINAN